MHAYRETQKNTKRNKLQLQRDEIANYKTEIFKLMHNAVGCDKIVVKGKEFIALAQPQKHVPKYIDCIIDLTSNVIISNVTITASFFQAVIVIYIHT